MLHQILQSNHYLFSDFFYGKNKNKIAEKLATQYLSREKTCLHEILYSDNFGGINCAICEKPFILGKYFDFEHYFLKVDSTIYPHTLYKQILLILEEMAKRKEDIFENFGQYIDNNQQLGNKVKVYKNFI